jgi:hypothetical protein
MLPSTPSPSDRFILGFDGTEDSPLVGVVISHPENQLLVTMIPDDSHVWHPFGWIAQDG